MDNLKYYLITFFIFILSLGWYIQNEEISETKGIEKLLTNKEKLKFLKNANLNQWYYKEIKYTIIKKRSKIPFIYDKIDTLKKPNVKFYLTLYPEEHNGNPNDDY